MPVDFGEGGVEVGLSLLYFLGLGFPGYGDPVEIS